MKSRIVLFAFCLALLSSCGNKGNDTGKVPEYAVQELQKSTANLTTAYPATIKGKQDVEIRPQVSGFITKLCVDEGATCPWLWFSAVRILSSTVIILYYVLCTMSTEKR